MIRIVEFDKKQFQLQYFEALKTAEIFRCSDDKKLAEIDVIAIQDTGYDYEVKTSRGQSLLFHSICRPEEYFANPTEILYALVEPSFNWDVLYQVINVTSDGAHLIIFQSLNEEAAEKFLKCYAEKHSIDPENILEIYIEKQIVFKSPFLDFEEDNKFYIENQRGWNE